MSKFITKELDEKDIHSQYRWAIIWAYIIVCYAPTKEFAENIARALNESSAWVDLQ